MFVRGENPIWFFNNLTGQPLDDTYYAFFLTNDMPYVPQPVYQSPNGTLWSNPIEFQPSGGLPNNLYFDPSLVYRIEIRQGPTQADPLIWLIQNYIPGSSVSSITDTLITSLNIIVNSQFADIYFESPLTYTQSISGTYTVQIGPGWALVLTGTGTTILTQGTFAGDSNTSGNPTYFLQINNSGWTAAALIQTFNNNGAIFAGGAIAVSFLAEATTTSQAITVEYEPSGPANDQNIFSGTVTTGGFNIYAGAIDLNDSLNTDTGKAASTTIAFNIAGTGVIAFTNIQVTGQSTPLSAGFMSPSDIPLYQEQTYEEIVNNEFNVYKPELFYKPIPSYLIGWDFSLNPSQRGTVFGPNAGANSSFYCWDQTIYFQSTSSGIATSRDSSGALSLSASVATQAAIIQYLPISQVNTLLEGPISVNLNGFLASGAGSGNVITTISLWVTTGTLPSVIVSNESIVATLNASGYPATFNEGSEPWIEIAPLNAQEATFTLNGGMNYPFNGYWNNNPSLLPSGITYLAIVIGTATVSMSDSLIFQSVSLQSGNIATIPSPQSLDEVLRQCQFYYEQSYLPGVVPGTTTNDGHQFNLQIGAANGGSNVAAIAGAFALNFKTIKNIIPVLTFYSSATGASNQVDISIINGGAVISTGQTVFSAHWTLAGAINLYNAVYIPTNATPLLNPSATPTFPEAYMLYQYVADSRLGQ